MPHRPIPSLPKCSHRSSSHIIVGDADLVRRTMGRACRRVTPGLVPPMVAQRSPPLSLLTPGETGTENDGAFPSTLEAASSHGCEVVVKADEVRRRGGNPTQGKGKRDAVETEQGSKKKHKVNSSELVFGGHTCMLRARQGSHTVCQVCVYRLWVTEAQVGRPVIY